MPMYEYVCEQCEASIEVLQKFSEDPLTTCESCGGPLHRPISRTSFALKGGGWYADGYSDSKGGGTKSAPAASTNTSTKSESKPKKEAKPKTG